MRRFAVLLAILSCGCEAQHCRLVQEKTVRGVLDGRPSGFVIIDVDSSDATRVGEANCARRWAPCSTFKIWNTMIALELGLVTSPDEPFYTWDGRNRDLAEWNKDLTLSRAFAVSCVPAFQTMAERIGPERMQDWLNRIDYGDRDISAGVTGFWLPRPGRKTILISADEQADLLRRLLRGELPFSAAKVSLLREIMRVRTTARGELFGKTGTGKLAEGPEQVAWFVGWVESEPQKQRRAFACVVRGDRLAGPDVRAIVEKILEADGLL